MPLHLTNESRALDFQRLQNRRRLNNVEPKNGTLFKRAVVAIDQQLQPFQEFGISQVSCWFGRTPEGDCPRWLAFLDEALGGDAAAIRFYQQWFGYCLTGDTTEHALVFVYGPGGSGKSTALNVMAELMRDYVINVATSTLTKAKHDAYPEELARMDGARLAFASETAKGKKWDENRIKALTCGDKITARYMRQNSFEFVPQMKLVIVGNNQPSLSDVDTAIKRRFNILPFNHLPTRKALKQSGAGLEAAIRRDLNAVIAAELDDITVNGLGSPGEPLGIIPGAATYSIASEDVSAAPTWSAFRTEIVAFMEANAITSASQVNLAFDPAIWAELDDTLISGTAVSEWDRLTKHVGNPAISNVIPTETAVMTANAGGIAPGYLGLYGGIDLIRDVYTQAASGSLGLTGLVTADFVVPRGVQTRMLTNLAGS